MRLDEILLGTTAMMLAFTLLLRGRSTGGFLEGARLKGVHALPEPVTVYAGKSTTSLLLPGPGANVTLFDSSSLAPSEGWPNAKPLLSASLLPVENHDVPMHPDRHALALASGCLFPAQPAHVSKEQKSANARNTHGPKACDELSVAVTADMHVLAFDGALQRQWEVPLVPHGEDSRAHEAVAVVAPHPAQAGDAGIVIAGVSLMPPLATTGTESASASAEELLEEEAEFEEAVEKDQHSSRDRLTSAGHGAEGNTFLLVAFDGKTGAERWRTHAFEQLEKRADEMDPQLHASPEEQASRFKDPAYSALRPHHGARPGRSISACKEYRESLMAVLPHLWNQPGDASAELAHFMHHNRLEKPRGHVSKHSQHKSDSKTRYKQNNAKGSRKHRKHLRPAGFSLVSPREQPHMPNVLVLHARGGIEAVEIHSGKPVCELPLMQGHVHVDLNGDGSVDHVQRANGRCTVAATTGVPPREDLFEAAACSATARGASVTWPHVTPRYGHVTAAKEVHDTLTLNSNGEVTSLSADGFTNWSVRTPASFTPGNADNGADEAVVPSIQPIGLRRGRGAEAILAVGSKQAVLLGLNGRQLASTQLPEPPIGYPSIIDADADNYADILIPTAQGQLVFHQRSPGAIVELRIILAALSVAFGVAGVSQRTNSLTASQIASDVTSSVARNWKAR